MKITHTSKDEILGWKRHIRFTYQNKEYEVNFYWDAYDGYSCENWVENGVDIVEPNWIDNYESVQNPDNTGIWGLFMDLDYLSYMFQEKVSA